MEKYGSVIRIIAHTQIQLIKLQSKKAQIIEIQVNGGTVSRKLKFARSLMENLIPIDKVFSKNENY